MAGSTAENAVKKGPFSVEEKAAERARGYSLSKTVFSAMEECNHTYPRS
jgi:hypothetical protein